MNKTRLAKKYTDEIRPQLQEQLQMDNVMMVPELQKIVLNVGVKEAVSDSKALQEAVTVLEKISGQRAVKRLARKSIAGFKLRQGMPIGAMVTLRGDKMYEFLDRLIAVALPRVRDFRGVNEKSFDGRGNYTLGVTEQIIFPEIDIDKVNRITGLDITFVTSANSDEEAYELLKELGMPFRDIKK